MPLVKHISVELLQELLKTNTGMQQIVTRVSSIITDRIEYLFNWDNNTLYKLPPHDTTVLLSTVITKCKKWALSKGYQIMSGYDLFNNGIAELTFSNGNTTPSKISTSSEEQSIIDICELILKEIKCL